MTSSDRVPKKNGTLVNDVDRIISWKGTGETKAVSKLEIKGLVVLAHLIVTLANQMQLMGHTGRLDYSNKRDP